MRFRLRTLMTVVALLALGLARLAHLKQRRDFHRQEVKKLLPELSGLDGNIDYTAETVIVLTTLPELKVAANWHRARTHEILAQQYDYAIYRPWTVVGDANIPNGKLKSKSFRRKSNRDITDEN